MVLDLLDKKIICETELNARISDTELSKRCHRSKDTIHYRLAKLKKQGILNEKTCFVDYTKLGMHSFKLYLTIDSTKDEFIELISWVKNKKELFCIFQAQTGWHLALAFFAKSFIAYESLEDELLEKFGHIIKKLILCHMIHAEICETGVLLERKRNTTPVFGEPQNHSLDETDKLILTQLHKDAAQTYVQISKNTGVPIDTIIRRKKKLEEKQIIRYYGAEIQYKKLGFEIYKTFIKTKNLSKKRENELKEYLRSLAQTRNIVFCIGPWKIETEFAVGKHDEMFNIVQDLKEKFEDCISNIEYTIFHEEYYYPAGLNLEN